MQSQQRLLYKCNKHLSCDIHTEWWVQCGMSVNGIDTFTCPTLKRFISSCKYSLCILSDKKNKNGTTLSPALSLTQTLLGFLKPVLLLRAESYILLYINSFTAVSNCSKLTDYNSSDVNFQTSDRKSIVYVDGCCCFKCKCIFFKNTSWYWRHWRHTPIHSCSIWAKVSTLEAIGWCVLILTPIQTSASEKQQVGHRKWHKKTAGSSNNSLSFILA